MTVLNPRTEGKNMQVLATKIEALGEDIGEMKNGITKLADAVTKLAVVEERQTHMILAQERAFKSLERIELRVENNEHACREQEKGLSSAINGVHSQLSFRIDSLEKSEPLQAQTSKWVMAAVWGTLGFLGLFVANRALATLFP